MSLSPCQHGFGGLLCEVKQARLLEGGLLLEGALCRVVHDDRETSAARCACRSDLPALDLLVQGGDALHPIPQPLRHRDAPVLWPDVRLTCVGPSCTEPRLPVGRTAPGSSSASTKTALRSPGVPRAARYETAESALRSSTDRVRLSSFSSGRDRRGRRIKDPTSTIGNSWLSSAVSRPIWRLEPLGAAMRGCWIPPVLRTS